MPTTELVWTGPSTMTVARRGTEQVLVELINSAEKQLTVMSFGIFQIARIVKALEQAGGRGIRVRIVIGDRETNRERDLSTMYRFVTGRPMWSCSRLRRPPLIQRRLCSEVTRTD